MSGDFPAKIPWIKSIRPQARWVKSRTRSCSGRWGEIIHSRISSFRAKTRFRSEAQPVAKEKFEVEWDDGDPGESLAAFSPFSNIFVV